MHTTHFIANGEIQTAFHDVGAGRPVVLIHGFTGSKLDFHDQLESFEDLGRVIAYDQRGHGESSNLGPYNMATLVADLIGFLDHMDLPSCDLLGHSLGGMVAMRAAIAQPQRFRSLLLMDTAAERIELTPANVREQLNALVLEEGCAALLKMMHGVAANPAAQRGIDHLGESEHWRRIGVKLAQMDADAFVALGAELDTLSPLADELSAITCPTTVMVGARDEPFVQPSKRLAEAIGNARFVSIPFAAHSPQYENADAWRDAVRAHLCDGC